MFSHHSNNVAFKTFFTFHKNFAKLRQKKRIMEKKDELEEDTTTSVEGELELISKPEVTFNSSIDENIISLQ